MKKKFKNMRKKIRSQRRRWQSKRKRNVSAAGKVSYCAELA